MESWLNIYLSKCMYRVKTCIFIPAQKGYDAIYFHYFSHEWLLISINLLLEYTIQQGGENG